MDQAEPGTVIKDFLFYNNHLTKHKELQLLGSKRHYHTTRNEDSIMDQFQNCAHHCYENEVPMNELFPLLFCTKESFNDFKSIDPYKMELDHHLNLPAPETLELPSETSK